MCFIFLHWKLFSLEKEVLCKKAVGDLKINKECADSPEPFLGFPQEGKKQTQTTGQYNDTMRSDNFLSSTKSLPYPVLVSEISDQSGNSHSRYYRSVPTKRSELKEWNSESINLPTSRPFSPDVNQEKIATINPTRPLSPSIKNIGDQTARAAFIRTLITERLNSCSPLGWQSSGKEGNKTYYFCRDWVINIF